MRKRLFQPAPRDGWRANAIVGGAWTSEWVYARGYLDAADVLVDQAIAGHRMDAQVYPICFLYRHAAEVTLKELVRDCEALLRLLVAADSRDASLTRSEEEVEKALTNTHGLVGLLHELETRLKLVCDDPLPEDVCEALRLLHEEDETGQRFRFSRVKQGKGKPLAASFPVGEHVDLRRLQQVLGPALGMLQGGVGGWLSHEQDRVLDYLAEMTARQGEYEAEMRADEAECEAEREAEAEANLGYMYGDE